MAKDDDDRKSLARLLAEAETDEERDEARAMLQAFMRWPDDDTPPEVVDYLVRKGAWD